MNLDTKSLERLVPDEVDAQDVTGHQTLSLHMDRYQYAAKNIKAGRLLDLACGVGYGSKLMSDQGPQPLTVLGVDISEDAVAYANSRYATQASDKLRYIASDGMKLQDAQKFDSIVSLETIEHVPDPEALIKHFMTLLKPGGIFIGSVPTTPSVDANPHHLHDFTERSFRALLKRHGLKEIDCFRQIQPFQPMPLLNRTEARAKEIRKNLPLYYLTHPYGLYKRIWSTLRYGFSNRYITIVCRLDG